MEAHQTSNPWTYLEIKKSKIKVTRPGPINVRIIEAVLRPAIVTAQYLSNGKFQTPKYKSSN